MCKDQPALYNSLLKHGFENHTFDILEVINIKLDRQGILDILNELEVKYITQFNCIRPHGLNIRTGGGQSLLSEESKNKIAEWHKGTHLHSDTKKKIQAYRKNKTYNEIFGKEKAESIRKNMSNARRGEKKTKEHRKHIGDSHRGDKNYNFGKHASPETIKKMKEARSKRDMSFLRKPIDKYSLNNEFICTYSSITDATKDVKAGSWDISNTCNGRQKSCRGFIWKYHNKEDNLKRKNK